MKKEESDKREVFCKRYNKLLPGLEAPPIKGDIGITIYEHLSAKAWADWIELQTMIINENKLNLMVSSDKNIVLYKLKQYIDGEDVKKPIEYEEKPTAIA